MIGFDYYNIMIDFKFTIYHYIKHLSVSENFEFVISFAMMFEILNETKSVLIL